MDLFFSYLSVLSWDVYQLTYISCTPMKKFPANPDLLGELYAKVEECTTFEREDINALTFSMNF